ncbi:MAG: hypothetical protein ABSH35_03110 [Isosphaeraceae bacterium]|jgi:hypothetical protein
MNLVNELQISAERDDVLTVLRKTKRLASKLDRRDISDWLLAEQNGYLADQDVPNYRVINTTIAIDTNGYVPAGYGQLMRGIVELPSSGLDLRMPFRASVSDVLSLIDSLNGNNGAYLSIEDGSDLSRDLRSFFGVNPMLSQHISFIQKYNSVQIKAIPEKIKDKVLEWACDLETAWVTGEGLSFSPKEKEIAHSVTFNIRNSNIEQLNNMGQNWKMSHD